MNICLVVQHSNYVTTNTGAALPNGIFYVAAALKNAGNNIFWIEFPNEAPSAAQIKSKVEKQILENKVALLMCGALFGGWREFNDICIGAKLANPQLIVAGGGGLFTHSPIEAMQVCENCDIGIIGEAEIISVKLVEALQNGLGLESVDGIVYRGVEGDIIKNKSGEYYLDLDALPRQFISPVFEKRIRHYREMSVVGGRSCPFSCSFCSLSTTKNYRRRSVSSVIHEIQYYIELYSVKRFVFIDELFTDSLERLYEYINALAPLNIEFFLQSRITEKLSVKVFEDLRQAGCVNFTLGVENINTSILKSMNKKTNPEMVIKCLNNIEAGECAEYFMIGYLMGDPAETIETAAASIKFFRNNAFRFKHFAFDLVNAYPGAKIYDDAVASGKIIPVEHMRNTYFTPPVVNLTTLSDTMFLLLHYYIAYTRIAYSHNRNIAFDFYEERGKKYFRYRCHCCEESPYTNISMDWWLSNSNEVAIYIDSFRCEFCGDVMCNATLREFYGTIGENLRVFLKANKCALRCAGIELMMFSKYIVDCDFMLIDRNIKFSAPDWEVYEKALGDPPVMSRILSEHPVQKSLPLDADVDVVIVLIHQYYDEIKNEVQRDRPDVKVIPYTDVITYKNFSA